MRIPINTADMLVWTLTRNGVYTVKSADTKLVELKENATTNEDPSMAKFRKQLWGIKICHELNTSLGSA